MWLQSLNLCQVRRLAFDALATIILLATIQEHASARTRAAATTQFEMQAPTAPQPIETGSANPGVQTQLESEVQRIESPPASAPPAINAPPIGSPPLVQRDNSRRAVDRALQQLQKSANPSTGYGTTTAAAQSAWQLGLIYLHGAGVRIDRPLAQQWFERSALQGLESWAYAGLAWCRMDGCAGPPDPGGATRDIQRLRPTHPGRADYLAWLQATQLHPLSIAAPGKSNSSVRANNDFRLLERAAAAGDIPATIEMGIIAFSNKDTRRAESYFRKVSGRSAVASHNLQLVQARDGVAPMKSVTNSAAQTALDMAKMYHRGQGVPANFAEAVRFYRLAEQRGSEEAHKMLELIFSRPMPDGSLNAAWMQQLANVDARTPIVALNSGVNTPQMQRQPSPLFDLLPAFWQQQIQQIAPP